MSGTTHFYDYEIGIYMKGLMGMKPELPMALAELEQEAKKKLTPQAYAYIAGGAGLEHTVSANREAFRKWSLVPRWFNDVSARNWNTEILGQTFKAPVMLAPIGVQEIIHPDCELAVARAAAALGIPMCLSTLSSTPLEQVAEALGDTPRWFQLYPPKDNEVAKSLIKRAEAAGFSAIVVTIDTRFMGYRTRDLQDAYLPFLQGQGIANYTSDPAFRAALDQTPEENMQGAIARWADIYSDQSHNWDYLKFVRDNTSLPVLAKGVLHPDEVKMAVEVGLDGVIVSNHGGRQLDGCIATLDALPGVVEEAGDKLTVIVDSGVRGGSDMIKALALGAKAVFYGRPYAWGLAVDGQEGVSQVMQRLLCEFDLNCALCGCTNTAEINASLLRQTS
jgi:lactate 2-monooxygenase